MKKFNYNTFTLSDAMQAYNMAIWGNNNNYVPKRMTWELMREQIKNQIEFFCNRNELGDFDRGYELYKLLQKCPFRKRF